MARHPKTAEVASPLANIATICSAQIGEKRDRGNVRVCAEIQEIVGRILSKQPISRKSLLSFCVVSLALFLEMRYRCIQLTLRIMYHYAAFRPLEEWENFCSICTDDGLERTWASIVYQILACRRSKSLVQGKTRNSRNRSALCRFALLRLYVSMHRKWCYIN